MCIALVRFLGEKPEAVALVECDRVGVKPGGFASGSNEHCTQRSIATRRSACLLGCIGGLCTRTVSDHKSRHMQQPDAFAFLQSCGLAD